jgi:hypothetical protein
MRFPITKDEYRCIPVVTKTCTSMKRKMKKMAENMDAK